MMTSTGTAVSALLDRSARGASGPRAAQYARDLSALCARYPKYFSGLAARSARSATAAAPAMGATGCLSDAQRAVKAFRGILNKISPANKASMIDKAKSAVKVTQEVGPEEYLSVVWDFVGKQGQAYRAEIVDIVSTAIGTPKEDNTGAASAFWRRAREECREYGGCIGSNGGTSDFDDDLCRYNKESQAYINRMAFLVDMGGVPREEVTCICVRGIRDAVEAGSKNLAMVYARTVVECACVDACRQILDDGGLRGRLPPIVKFKLMDARG